MNKILQHLSKIAKKSDEEHSRTQSTVSSPQEFRAYDICMYIHTYVSICIYIYNMLYVYIANRWIPILQPRQKHGHPILASLQGARWKDVRHFAIPGFCHMLQSPGSWSPKNLNLLSMSEKTAKNDAWWCFCFLAMCFSETSFIHVRCQTFLKKKTTTGPTKALHGDTSHHFSSCFSPNLPEDLGSGQGALCQIEFKKQKNRISTRWFNLTFVESPIWRSLWIWTGHLMIPKRSPKIARHGSSYDVFFRGVGWSL